MTNRCRYRSSNRNACVIAGQEFEVHFYSFCVCRVMATVWTIEKWICISAKCIVGKDLTYLIILMRIISNEFQRHIVWIDDVLPATLLSHSIGESLELVNCLTLHSILWRVVAEQMPMRMLLSLSLYHFVAHNAHCARCEPTEIPLLILTLFNVTR